ncbi:hypothetical protein MMC34_001958 [Xylographa carneopallida]|nr:hypothetical protein [Xylographa carneopallida]
MSDATKYSAKLSGSRILIIGGTSGIGYSVAEACLEAHATVILSSSQPSRIESAIASLLSSYPSAKPRLSGFPCNLATVDTLEANVASLFSKCGPLNHVVYTAGDKLATMPLDEITLPRIQQAGMTRFFAPLIVAQHAARVLPRSPASSLVLTTGSVSERPMPSWAVINSYATGLHGMTRGLALDMKPIRVNLVSPGAVHTPLWDGMSKEAFEAFQKESSAKTATGVFGRAEDVAESYMGLLRDNNITGSVVSTNSGALLM